MGHVQVPMPPIDVLQPMINGILIEIGKALRAANKEGGKTLANSNTRLRSSLPGAIDNFHQALDDLEGDIVRAQAVFSRDLEHLQARRYALENPRSEPLPDLDTHDVLMIDNLQENVMMEKSEVTPQPRIKDEETGPQEPALHLGEVEDTKLVVADIPEDFISKGPENPEGPQGLSSPVSMNGFENKSNLTGLVIDTTASTDDLALATSEIPVSAIDSLFDMDETGNNETLDMTFDATDFLDSSNTQGHNDFDLSTFGNTEDFNLDLQVSNDAINTENSNKQDEIFGMENTGGGSDLMDLDMDLGTAGGDASAFDDMFDFGGDSGGGREMEHGDIDSNFFGTEG